MPEQDKLTREHKQAGGHSAEAASDSLASVKRRLSEQKRRISALARDREANLQQIEKLSAELALVSSERDKLRKALTALEGMQTETVTLDDKDIADFVVADERRAPSIDELMSSFTGTDSSVPLNRADSGAGSDSGEYQEMISPEDIVLGSNRDRSKSRAERYLLLVSQDGHVRCPLDQELLTIGRSDSADIQVDGDFVSRIHARILRIGMDSVIEDAGSKNGTRVNSDPVQRHVLKHGDLVRIGSVCFRYIDTAMGSDGAE